MFTQCPHCNLSFRITADVLKQASGKVRCGGCRETFNALEFLSEEQPDGGSGTTASAAPPDFDAEFADESAADLPPEAISPEQSDALLAEIERLAETDVRLEDTGVEWRILGGDDEDEDATADADDTRQEEIRFDDNTPLPDDFDHDAPSAPPVAKPAPPPARKKHTDTHVDIAFGDPEEWSELLGEIVADEQAADEPVATEDPGESDALDQAFEEMHALLADAETETSTEIGEELERAQRTLEDTSIEEDLMSAAFQSEYGDRAANRPMPRPAETERRPDPGPGMVSDDGMGDSMVLDIDAMDDESLSIDLGELAANEAGRPSGDTSVLEELEEAIEILPDEEDTVHEVAPLSEKEMTINQMIDQELLSVAYEDEDGMTSTIIIDKEAARQALDSPVEESSQDAEGAADEDGSDDADEKIGIVTVVMEGDDVRDALDDPELEGGLEIDFPDETDPEIEALKAKVAARAEAEAEAEERAIRAAESRRMIGGIAALLVLLIGQGIHFSRAALATVPGIAGAIVPVYETIGLPITPAWDVTGWRFEVTKGSTDPTRFTAALGGGAEPAADPDAPEVLTIYSRVGNRSTHALPYPLVAVSLTDRFEETIGSRVLEPAEYLPEGVDRMAAVQPGRSFDAVVSIDTPDAAATGFRLNVCYRQADRRLRCAIEDFK